MPKNKIIKKKINIFFDLVDTLMFQKKNKVQLLKNFLKSNGKKISKTKLTEAIGQTEEEFHYSELTSENKKEFYLKFNKSIQKKLNLSEKYFSPEDYFLYRSKIKSSWHINKKEILLLKKYHKIHNFYIASNFSLKAFAILRRYKIDKYFKKIYISSKIKFEKPNLNFYKFIIKDSKINPKNSFFVGDNYNLDYKVPKSLGFKSILINQLYLKNKKINSFKNLKNFLNHLNKNIYH